MPSRNNAFIRTMYLGIHATFIINNTISQCSILVPCCYLSNIAIDAGIRALSETRRSMQGRSSRNAEQLVQAFGILGFLEKGAF